MAFGSIVLFPKHKGVAMFRFLAVLFLCLFANIRAGAVEKNDLNVMGVGSAIIDLLVQVDDDFFTSHFSERKGGSYQCDPETLDRILRDVAIQKTAPGGSAGNTLRALAKLGMPCQFSTHVGDDPSGDCFCKEMGQLGIAGIVKDPEFSTMRILCLITPDGERTFLYCHKIHDWDVVPAAENFPEAKWIHFESFLVWEAPHLIERSLQLAHETGATISLDLSNFNLVQQYKDKLQEWLERYVDVVFGNEEEVRILTGLSPEEACMRLQEICPIAVVTKGSKGCLVGQRGKLVEVPAFAANVVDTTGAGDYFSAGFIYGCLHDLPLADCARIGNRMGSTIVEVVGTDLPEEKWEEIRNFLKNNES